MKHTQIKLSESQLKTLGFLKVIYWVMLVNPIIYTLLAWFRVQSMSNDVNTQTPSPATPKHVFPMGTQNQNDDVMILCAGVGFGAAIIALILYRRGMHYRQTKKIAKDKKENHFMKVMLITWVLFEICAASGLALSFITRSLSDITPFIGVSLLGIMSHPPSQGRLRRLIAGK